MNTNEQDLWELLEDPDAVLVIDNDMCYIRYEDEDREGESFDFGPMELVYMFAEKMNINTEAC